MKKVVFLLLAFCLMIPFGIASADDPAVGSKEDNACNAGGSLAGKCSTALDWTCGWYLARYEAKTFSRAQVPALCVGFLPGAGTASVADSINTRETVFCVTLAPPEPFAGEVHCVSGNLLTIDGNGDGVIDFRVFIGTASSCPSGTPPLTIIGNYPSKQLEIFLNSLGFTDDQLLCL